ncbi:LOW QUALITY PROTEIN: harmonin-like [Argopecten irradians]|uniref:LOW QUALITY PROTEIN: harmonin-like n=1 Tax=Argopecten irradians TaxID=31199 RepID=UPI0037241F7B
MNCCSNPDKKRRKKIRAIETENWIHRFHSEYCWVKRLPEQIHRPLIPAKHQLEFDRLAPTPPGRGRRIINLRRRTNESLGFAVRGGFEHGIGVFVSHIDPGSQAERQGLRVGDEIVRVNGYTISQAIHEEVLNLIKGRDAVELKVTNIGMLPVKEKQGDALTWIYVEKRDRKKSVVSTLYFQQQRPMAEEEGEVVKLFANLRTSPSLGCSIMSGPQGRGIYIQRVGPQSLGEQIGLEVGDQILEVNGISFLDVSHNEAIVALKSSKELNLVIRKKSGIHIVQSSAINTRTQTPRDPPKHEQVESNPLHDEERVDPNRYRDQEPEYAVVMKEKKKAAPPPAPTLVSTPAPPPPPPPLPVDQTTDRPKTKKKAPAPPSVPPPSVDFTEGTRDVEGTARLEKILQQKQASQRQIEERQRQEVYESNRRKRNALEHKLLQEIRQHKRNSKKDELKLRQQRRQQDEDEMKREVRAVSDILRGRGRPLRKADLELVGPDPGFSPPVKSNPSSPAGGSESEETISPRVFSPISDIDDYVVEKRRGHDMDNSEVTDIDSVRPLENLPYSFIQ